MKKFISVLVSTGIALWAFAALADSSPMPKPSLTRTPKVERETSDRVKSLKEQKDAEKKAKEAAKKAREAARKVCQNTFNNARKIREAADKNARQSFLVASKVANTAWKASDKGAIAKTTFAAAKKAAQEALTLARLNARIAWDAAISAHNSCVRQSATATPVPVPSQ